MATTLTRNLKLRLNSNLTADAKYNLERLDLLGGTFLTDTTDTLKIRSRTNILIEPESGDLGGAGSGGTVSIGSPGMDIDELQINAVTISFSGSLSLKDQAVGGTKYLELKYKTDIDGSVDTLANRVLFMDLDGADRNLVLGGDLQVLGGSLALSVPSNSSLTLPASGTLSTLNGTETLTNKTISAGSNTLSGITNASIDNAAAINYSKLNLASSVLNSDISPSAAIAYSKLLLTASVVVEDLNSGSSLNGQVPTSDGAGGVTWQDQQGGGGGGGGGRELTAVWAPGDGATKTVTHNWGTRFIQVEVLENSNNYKTIDMDSVERPTSNTIVVYSSSAPASNWTVTLKEIT